MPVLLFFLIWCVLELFVVIAVGEAIGAILTVLLLVLSFVLGVMILRGQSLIFALRLRTAQLNRESVGIGIYRLLGAVLLIIPGFLSDFLALLILIPNLRELIGLLLLRAFNPDKMAAVFGFRARPDAGVYEYDGAVSATREDGSRVEAELIHPPEK